MYHIEVLVFYDDTNYYEDYLYFDIYGAGENFVTKFRSHIYHPDTWNLLDIEVKPKEAILNTDYLVIELPT